MAANRAGAWIVVVLAFSASVASVAGAESVASGTATDDHWGTRLLHGRLLLGHTVAADLDGDGDTDLAAASRWNGAFGWWEHDGGRPPAFTFRPLPHRQRIPVQVPPVDAGDLDGDGDTDLVARPADQPGWWEAEVTDGGTTFTRHDLPTAATSLALGDGDGDGDLDVFTTWTNLADPDQSVTFLENDGGASPSFTNHVVTMPLAYRSGIDLADLEGDGDLDVLVDAPDGPVWLLNDGSSNPSFTPTPVPGVSQPSWATPADLDRDGDQDVVTVADNTATAVMNDGSSGSRTTTLLTDVAGLAHTVADMNADGAPDLVAVTPAGEVVVVHLRDGQPLDAPGTVVSRATRKGVGITTSDVDGDGAPDVIVAGVRLGWISRAERLQLDLPDTRAQEYRTVELSATGSAPSGPPTSYEWEWSSETPWFADASGRTVRYDATSIDGPATRTIQVRMTAPSGAVAVDRATLAVADGPARVRRYGGRDRIETALAASRARPGPQRSPPTVVLARADDYADALAGGVLAAHGDGFLLLTPPDHLPDEVLERIETAVWPGGRVVLLGGASALAPAVADRLEQAGFDPHRLAGSDRFETAAAIAEFIIDHHVTYPETTVLATGHDFPDALAAAAYAGASRGIVLLTDGSSPHPATDEILAAREPESLLTVGGHAAAAYPQGEAVVGISRYETARLLAERFDAPRAVGLARADVFADALSGAAVLGRRAAPMLLVPPDGGLGAQTSGYLCEQAVPIDWIDLFGGVAAIPEATTDIARDRTDGRCS